MIQSICSTIFASSYNMRQDLKVPGAKSKHMQLLFQTNTYIETYGGIFFEPPCNIIWSNLVAFNTIIIHIILCWALNYWSVYLIIVCNAN